VCIVSISIQKTGSNEGWCFHLVPNVLFIDCWLQCLLQTQHTSTKGVRRLRSEPGDQRRITVGCLFYSRRYLRVCDSRWRRWPLRAPTPSEPRPDLRTRRRSPESRTGSPPSPPCVRPCCGGWELRVCGDTRTVASWSRTRRELATGLDAPVLP